MKRNFRTIVALAAAIFTLTGAGYALAVKACCVEPEVNQCCAGSATGSCCQ